VAGQDEDFILVDADFQRNEAVAGARSVDAEAVLDLEQGAVDLADEVFLARAEKAARSPVERRSLVRTAVEVRPKHVSLTDHHDPGLAAVARECEAFGLAVRKIGHRAHSFRRHASIQAISHNFFQASGGTGETESREWRTSGRSAKSGSALI